MDTQFTKVTGHSSADTLNNRLTRLENILQNLLELMANTRQNSENSLIKSESMRGDSNFSEKLLEQISDIHSSRNKFADGNDTKFTIKRGQSTNSGNVNNLPLSHSQIIAEIAAAISRLGSRNS